VGVEIDHQALRRSQIPWAHRADTGRVRAIRRTVWRAMFRTRHLSREIARPVDYRDARRFQATVILWVVGGLTVLAAGCLLVTYDLNTPVSAAPCLTLGFFFAGVVCLTGFLITATGVQTYWLHPHRLSTEQQNRSIAFGYYAAAPLVFVPLCALLMLVAFGVGVVGQRLQIAGWSYFAAAIALISVGALGAMPVAYYRIAMTLNRRAAHRRGLGLWSMVLGLPVCGLVLGLF